MAAGSLIVGSKLIGRPVNGSLVGLPPSGGGGARVYATWNPLDKDAVLVLTNSDRTATASSAGSGSVRATIGLASGKWRFKISAASAEYTQVGVGTAAADVSDYLGPNAESWGYSSHNYWYHGGSAVGPAPAPSAGYGPSSDVDCYVNLDDNLFYVYVDGVIAGGAAQNISSRGSAEMFPMGGFFANGNTFTINCGQESMGTPVAGFEAYLPWGQA